MATNLKSSQPADPSAHKKALTQSQLTLFRTYLKSEDFNGMSKELVKFAKLPNCDY